jgi:hypothetical protein
MEQRSLNQTLTWIALILMGLIFGTLEALLGWQQYQIRAVASGALVEIRLNDFLRDGPGAARHVKLTHFTFGKQFVVETSYGVWTNVWIPLFPENAPSGPAEIEMVAHISSVRNEDQLRQFRQRTTISGICSDAPSSLGTTIGEKLRDQYPGAMNSAAWDIKEMAEPPSAENIRWHFVAAGALLMLALAGSVVLWLRSRAARERRAIEASLQSVPEPDADAAAGPWLPPASIVGHDGRRPLPNADFFHRPPDRIGAVLSAATTRTESSGPLSTRRRYVWSVRLALLGAAILFPTPVWMVYAIWKLHSLLAVIFICAGGLASGILGAGILLAALLAMLSLKSPHVCSYVGKEGLARYIMKGAGDGRITATVMRFADAAELRTSRTAVHLHGAHIGTAYRFRWTDATGYERCELAGDYRATGDALPKPGHQFYFAAAAEAAWSEYRLDALAAELKRRGVLQFNLEDGRWVGVGPGCLEFSWGADGPVHVALDEIAELKLEQGQFRITHKDAAFFSRKGKFHFAYGSMANARLFVLALQRLLGYQLRR